MTTLVELQQELKITGRYCGEVDGQWGALTQAGILLALTDGPDTRLFLPDYVASAARMSCPVGHICALAEVEANGAGFFGGRPKILPEPHVFSRLTKGRFDKTHPHLSYPKWGTRPYPPTQDERYLMLLAMVRLDIDAGFAACSYGKFQIMGENHANCGYRSSFSFAVAMARDEKTQLRALEEFLRPAILPYLRLGEWAKVARAYNGTAYAKNRYDVKLAQAASRLGDEIERGVFKA